MLNVSSHLISMHTPTPAHHLAINNHLSLLLAMPGGTHCFAKLRPNWRRARYQTLQVIDLLKVFFSLTLVAQCNLALFFSMDYNYFWHFLLLLCIFSFFPLLPFGHGDAVCTITVNWLVECKKRIYKCYNKLIYKFIAFCENTS